MRSADAATFIRVLLVLIVAYLILAHFNPFILIVLFAAALILDAVDGFLALSEASKGALGISKYIRGLTGDSKIMKEIKETKLKTAKLAPYGPRLDVIGDRIIEYSLYALFTYVHVIPLFVLFIIIIRNCSADGLMGLKGTSSKMKTRFAQIMYSSAPSRAAANILKFLTFSYLMLQYIAGYPAIVGDVLVAILVIFSVVRGVSEIYEALI
jgi:phosphatidylglycerophosphate synthase